MEWALAALLGLGLAASSGLKTFLPLLMLAVAARLHVAGITLPTSGPAAWLAGAAALLALTVATILELVGDAVPVVDHLLDSFGTVARPVAGWLAAAAALGGVGGVDPTVAALVGLILGAPAALSLHTAKASARAASTATTLGAANPLLSIIENVVAFALSLVSLLTPLLVPLALVAVGWAGWKAIRAARAARRRAAELVGGLTGRRGDA